MYTGKGKSMFKIVCMENNTLICNNTRVKSVFCTLTVANLLLPVPRILNFPAGNTVHGTFQMYLTVKFFF